MFDLITPSVLSAFFQVIMIDLVLAGEVGTLPVEIKLGVLTAMIGVPFFLSMIFSERRMLEGAPA